MVWVCVVRGVCVEGGGRVCVRVWGGGVEGCVC